MDDDAISRACAEAHRRGVDEGRRIQARLVLMRILHRRHLEPTAAERAIIEECEELARLEWWIDQAIDSTSVATLLAPID